MSLELVVIIKQTKLFWEHLTQVESFLCINLFFHIRGNTRPWGRRFNFPLSPEIRESRYKHQQVINSPECKMCTFICHK